MGKHVGGSLPFRLPRYAGAVGRQDGLKLIFAHALAPLHLAERHFERDRPLRVVTHETGKLLRAVRR